MVISDQISHDHDTICITTITLYLAQPLDF